MNKLIFTTLFSVLFPVITLFADMPGNKPRPDCLVKFQGLNNLNEYQFYAARTFDDTSTIVNDSSTIVMVGGFGTPSGVSIYAKNLKNGKETQEIFAYGDHSKVELTILISNIIGDSTIEYVEIKHNNYENSSNATVPILNKESKNQKWALIGIAVVALDVLLLAFIVRRRKKSNPNKNV